jgi:hypothetical protein
VAYALVPPVKLTHDKIFVHLGRRVDGNDVRHPRGAWPALEPLSENQQLIRIAAGERLDVTVRQIESPRLGRVRKLENVGTPSCINHVVNGFVTKHAAMIGAR